jgi:hypothetical protein
MQSSGGIVEHADIVEFGLSVCQFISSPFCIDVHSASSSSEQHTLQLSA